MKPDDFEEQLANCADEPIRIPGAIQPHGVLLTLSEPELNILQVSANVATLFNHAPEALLGQPLHALLGAEPAAAVGSMVEHDNFIDAPPLHVTFNGTTFDSLLHRHQGALVLEFEPLLENFKPRALNGRSSDLGKMLQRLQSAKSLQALYEISVTEIQAMTGYDRVLIYRFEDQGHGQVIAEASAPSMELFNGLFFPASDIPEQARELYRTNWLRIIPNAAYTPVPLLPRLRPDNGQPLDLSFASLRSVSPIHCQYMQNMGVLSSMSISLMKGDKLWGLISCGNREPLLVPSELRLACQTIGQVLSLQISAMEALDLIRQREEKAEGLVLLDQAMKASDKSVFDGLAKQPHVLMHLTLCTGVAIIEDQQLHCFGICPKPEQILALYKWLQKSGEPVFSSHNLASVYPPAAEFQQVGSGVLAMSLPKPIDNGVLWFRPEVKESLNWCGNPVKPMALDNAEKGPRLQPRTSFEVWKVEMAGISTQWSHGDRFAANDLRRSALENDLARQVLREQQAVRARDDLVAVVSHDLRNPMTVISMLCGMLQQAFSSEGAHTSRRISSAIETMLQAAGRMNVLLEDLLDTSKIEAGRYVVKPVALEVSQMFEEAYSLLVPLAMEKGIDLSFNTEPGLQIKGDPERMFQVLSNLIGNAIKFTPRQGTIDISAISNGEEIVFSVRDSGEGIAPDQLLHVFERYWTQTENNPTGSGLGLYITQGIIQAHGGKIVAESELGRGSEFRFTVPKVDQDSHG